jgi:hypothetical protein
VGNRLGSLPGYNFLVAWEMTQDERKKIKQFFGLTFEEGNLSIWNRTQNKQSNADLYREKIYKEVFLAYEA